MQKEKILGNPNTLNYYSNNFKFYITGFCIALGIFIILFVLGFFSFNKTPKLLNNPKILNYIGDNAFTGTIIGKKNSKIEINSGTILSSYPTLYHIGEKQIPNIEKSYYIVKKQKNTPVIINSLLRDLRLPEIKTNALQGSKITNLSFNIQNKDYTIDLDLENSNLNIINNNINSYSTGGKSTEKDIKKIIKSEMDSLGFNLKHYGEPEISQNIAGYANLFYPMHINNIPVYLPENQQEGFQVKFDLNKGEILTITNYSTQTYQLSKTSFQKTKEDLLKDLQKRGDVDISKKGQNASYFMEKGELVYQLSGNYLIPSIRFKSKNTKKVIFLPLY